MIVNTFRLEWGLVVLLSVFAGTSCSKKGAPSGAGNPAATITGIYGSEGRGGDYEVIGEFRHHCNFDVEDIRLKFGIFDASGAKVGEAQAGMSSLAPGTAWKFSARGTVSAPSETYTLEGAFCKYGRMRCEVKTDNSPAKPAPATTRQQEKGK